MPTTSFRLLALAGSAALAAAPLMAQPADDNGPRIEPEPGSEAPARPAQPANDQPETNPIAGIPGLGAGPGAGPEAGPRIAPQIPTTASLFAGVIYDGSSDANGSAAEISSVRFPVRFQYATPLNNQNILGVSLNQVSSFYDFQESAAFPGSGDPLDYALAANVGLSLIHLYDRQWRFIAAANIGFSGEIDADFQDSIVGGGILGARYQVNPDLSIGANLIVQTRIQNDTVIFPVPTVDWQISDYWNLQLGTLNQLPGTVTGGLAVTHDLTDTIDIGGFVGGAFGEYRLADDNSSVSSGILEDTAIPLGTFLTYDYSPNVSIRGSVHAVVWREITLRSTGGGSVGEVEYQPTLAASLGVQIKL
ncbi:MAG: DUF6268 family outer membrane beta-barrel protein [Planctomycetota bacterium]